MHKKENKIQDNKKREAEKDEKLPYDPNINSEDKQALHDKNFNMDEGQDKPLAEREDPVDFTAKDLDIPGRNDADNTNEGTSIPDEENLQFDERGARPEETKRSEHPDREDDPLIDKDDKERG